MANRNHSNKEAKNNREQAIANEMQRLSFQVKKMNDAYYLHDAPLVTDAEYDLLLKRLEDLEEKYPQYKLEDSPTEHVGGGVASEFLSGTHRFPMLSLNDVFSKDKILEFTANVRKQYPNVKFVVEQKIDGLSVSLEYKNGLLIEALTRGDGATSGEIVTENVRQIKTVPQVLSENIQDLVVRGEIYMTNQRFAEINQEQEAKGEKLFANPRNSAAGTLRQLDSNVVRERGLSIFIFNVQYWQNMSAKTHHESLIKLSKLGFPVSPNYYLCQSDEEVLKAIDQINDLRPVLDYGIDGAVIKVDSLTQREELGSTSKVPRWAVAYKYPPEQQETVVEDLIVQVGRTGRITPMALLQPVVIDQSTVSKATLHNQDYIDSLDIRLHDTVTVHKGGDIIPAVIAVDYSKRKKEVDAFKLPDKCPVCGAPTAYLEDGANLYCTGLDCPAQLARKLEYFASKAAMDIEGLGESSVAKLLEKGHVKHLSDIYRLDKKRDILIEEGDIGRQKRVDNLLKAIEASKKKPFDRFIAALGIHNIGPQTAKNLVEHFPDIETLSKADLISLQSVPDIGPNSAKSIVDFFAQEQTKKMIEEFKELGINMVYDVVNKPEVDSVINNKTFVLTGTLPTLTRSQAKDLIEKYGGKVTSAVSAKTDYLLAGERAGSKLKRAETLEIEILTEAELISLLDI